jgi:hypothetical protein
MRGVAGETLGDLRDPRAAEALLAATRDESHEMRVRRHRLFSSRAGLACSRRSLESFKRGLGRSSVAARREPSRWERRRHNGEMRLLTSFIVDTGQPEAGPLGEILGSEVACRRDDGSDGRRITGARRCLPACGSGSRRGCDSGSTEGIRHRVLGQTAERKLVSIG